MRLKGFGAMKCAASCTKTIRAVAHTRGGPGMLVVCVTCGNALTPNHGLSAEEILVIVELARKLHANSVSSRLTIRNKAIGGKDGKARQRRARK